MTEFLRALAPVKRRIRLGRVMTGAAAGFVFGAAAALVLLIVTAFVPLENRWIIAGTIVPGGIALGAAGGALRKVKNMDAARAADACGLQERCVTALELAEKQAVPFVSLLETQRKDACEHLRALDVRRIRLKPPKRLLAFGAGLLVLCAGTLLIAGGGDRIVAERKELREKTAAMAKQIDEAEASEEKGLTEKEKAELRKLTEDLKRELDDSRDSVDALVALDKAEQRLEEFRQKTAGDAMQEMADAMRNAGMDAAAEAMDSGDAAAMQAELSELSVSDLQQLAEGLSSAEAKELAEQLAKMAESGEMSEAQLQAMTAAAQNGSGALQQALNAMKAMLGGSGAQQGGQNGQGQSGSGAGSRQGQAGGGAGTGTTNEEQKGGGGGRSAASVQGKNPAEYKEAQYETIYDPEKVDAAARDVSTEQNALGKDSVQIETGPGKGSLNGDVPYREVVGEYAQTEVQAAENAHLTREQKEWVDEYFRRLTDE